MSDSADDEPTMLGMDLPDAAPQPSSGPYRVLARKYRPQTFAELIGQDAMVRTLGNAIARDRLAHAFLMTGVRGVGKTSTARLIAKALNCIGPDGQGGPTIDPCGVCEPCRAITEGRHIDVIEMDAASNTGVDDVREIIEAVRYAAVSARYKIYIIDEVHMLSRNAFNALLKTLEEPPPHVKFLFATTEVNKVPVTVLSRCQRFDLRRITPDMLFAHFSAILQKEGVEAEAPAIWLIANAAEGSVRDGLSILDQAIAHADLDGGGKVSADQVRAMLGLSDRSSIAQLMATILEGDAGAAIDLARAQYALGIEPVAMVRGLMDLTHAVTLAKVSRHDDPALAEADRERIGEWAKKLGFAPLNRLWQLLLKGHDEVLRANNPLEHLEMLLLRVIYAASMPDPGELAKLLQSGGVPMAMAAMPAPTGGQGDTVSTITAAPPPVEAEVAAPARAEPPASALTVAQIHQLLESTGNHRLAVDVYDHMRIVELEPGSLVFAPVPALDGSFARDLGDALLTATGSRWHVRAGDGKARPSLKDVQDAKGADNDQRIRELPVVKAALAAFPDATLVEGDDTRHKSAP
ncbi:DNA polymerase III subunit gamma/tau [Sphingopyxis witflariensis]|uniref:DNA polymerase III subunit gamma/tau n=1 Tax=Sphingopyxis witflariensis TaxID=173675 RepID=A0A246K521_9SPHN|nr:DNA polymerase III subunit gamma/tau [Sphingopyxis witflariensis]OWR01096.1 DNA polymerase III subunit gamma/tau [Sphingopyxis witflariensis]